VGGSWGVGLTGASKKGLARFWALLLPPVSPVQQSRVAPVCRSEAASVCVCVCWLMGLGWVSPLRPAII
jgi:hypothetical protein